MYFWEDNKMAIWQMMASIDFSPLVVFWLSAWYYYRHRHGVEAYVYPYTNLKVSHSVCCWRSNGNIAMLTSLLTVVVLSKYMEWVCVQWAAGQDYLLCIVGTICGFGQIPWILTREITLNQNQVMDLVIIIKWTVDIKYFWVLPINDGLQIIIWKTLKKSYEAMMLENFNETFYYPQCLENPRCQPVMAVSTWFYGSYPIYDWTNMSYKRCSESIT